MSSPSNAAAPHEHLHERERSKIDDEILNLISTHQARQAGSHPQVQAILGPTSYVPNTILIRGIQIFSVAFAAGCFMGGFY